MNVIKDVIFEGKILDIIKSSVDYLKTQIKEKTYLGADGLFVTEAEYPVFVRQEMIVNAVTHRAYSISGTDIQIKMFDNRIVVESPGQLPGLVRKENIRYTHFSRNPKIAEFLKAYQFVKEYGEGVDRMCKELEQAGLKAPEYFTKSFLLQAVVYNAASQKLAIGDEKLAIATQKLPIGTEKLAIEEIKRAIEGESINKPTIENIVKLYENIKTNQIFTSAEVANILSCSESRARKLVALLRKSGVVIAVKGKGAGKGKYRFVNQNEPENL